MRIVNKLKIIAVVTSLSLASANQSAFSKHNPINGLENVKNHESETLVTELKNNETLLVSSQKIRSVNDSSIILPIPQPLGVLCLFGIAGVSSFLKLKIARVKYKKQSEEKIKTTDIVDKSVQILNR